MDIKDGDARAYVEITNVEEDAGNVVQRQAINERVCSKCDDNNKAEEGVEGSSRKEIICWEDPPSPAIVFRQ